MSGAVHAVAPHPTDRDTLYIGSANGGVWKTTNATAASPTWTPLTDDQASRSIGALEFDRTDGAHDTLVAGIGRFSSFQRRGGPLTGAQGRCRGRHSRVLADRPQVGATNTLWANASRPPLRGELTGRAPNRVQLWRMIRSQW